MWSSENMRGQQSTRYYFCQWARILKKKTQLNFTWKLSQPQKQYQVFRTALMNKSGTRQRNEIMISISISKPVHDNFLIQETEDKTNNNSKTEIETILWNAIAFVVRCVSVASLMLKWLTTVLLSYAVKSHNWIKLVWLVRHSNRFAMGTLNWNDGVTEFTLDGLFSRCIFFFMFLITRTIFRF